jgi:hypothetical protein
MALCLGEQQQHTVAASTAAAAGRASAAAMQLVCCCFKPDIHEDVDILRTSKFAPQQPKDISFWWAHLKSICQSPS